MAGRMYRFDWVTFSLYFSIMAIGWLMLYAVSFSEFDQGAFALNTTIGRQTIWLGIALIAFLFCQIIDPRFWKTFAIPIYAATLVALLLVLLIGVEVKGARSWFNLFGFSFQPAEFAKFATILALSSYLGHYETKLRSLRSQLVALSLIAIPAGLILLQPDAGSALAFSAFLLVLYREGMPASYFGAAIFLIGMLIAGLVWPLSHVVLVSINLSAFVVLLGLERKSQRRSIWVPLTLVGVTALHWTWMDLGTWIYLVNAFGLAYLLILAWNNRQPRVAWSVPLITSLGIGVAALSGFAFNQLLEPHQQDRINVWLQPDKCDPQGSLYNIIQSKVAIGSGGLSGKGFLEGTMTKLNFVPEQSTDFIFSTIGEEQGFLGSAAVILLFFGLILRIIYLGETQENAFVRNIAYGIGGLLFFHVFVNIGMTMGLVPIIGIPLPFVSKGGTAMLSFTIMLSVFLRFVKERR